MNKLISNYLESMIYDFSVGNDNEYNNKEVVEFKYEEIEKSDLDNYDEVDVNMFYEVRKYISEVGEVMYNNYKFIVKENDIICILEI